MNVIPTTPERSIDWIDLLPSLSPAVHRVYSDTADSHGHAHQRPRTLFPPTAQRARTVHAASTFPLAEALHTLDCDWPSVATRRCVLWGLFFFFFPPPHVLHTQLREKGASQRKKTITGQAAALAIAVSLFYTGFDNKKVIFKYFIPPCQRENS